MAQQTETVTVAVHDQVLWIGSEAFPVRNITHASTRVLVRPRADAARSYLLFALVSTLIAVVVVVLVGGVLSGSFGLPGPQAVGVVLLVVLAVRLVGLIRFVAGPDLYVFVLETAGGNGTRLLSRDRGPVDRLVREVMAAVHDPTAGGTFHLNVVNEGDRINVGGTFNEVRGSHHRIGG